MPTIKEVIEDTEGTFPAPLVEIANGLAAAKSDYSGKAAEVARQVFLAQDELGLSGNDVIQALTEVADLKQGINNRADTAFEVLSQNFVPEEPAVALEEPPADEPEVTPGTPGTPDTPDTPETA